MSEPTVAVCTDRSSPFLSEVVGALRSQGAEPLVVQASGIAAARNRALQLCATPVIAYIDDDVVVGDGWWVALRAAWARADEDLGALGGPISGARAALDLGDAARDLDPGETTLHGGNLSFRAEALRGVQGLWPGRGAPGIRDWFGEEHHAQRELGETGWRVRYVPELRAQRLGPADGPRQRFRYGVRLGRMAPGVRPSQRAAATAARAAAGTLAAVATGRRELAGDRARRAAENLGALLAPAVPLRDFEPDAPCTPFRATVPSGRRPRRARGAAVLLYHRIAATDDGGPHHAVTPEHFAEHLAVLDERANPMALGELVERAERGTLPPRSVAVTIDDAYPDALTAAAPRLVAAGLPATVFVPTGLAAARQGFWWDELTTLLCTAPAGRPRVLRVTTAGQTRAWAPDGPAARLAARRHLHAWLQPLDPGAIAEALCDVAAWAGIEVTAEPPLDPESVAELARQPGIEVGAHTRSHIALAGAPRERQRAEIAGSREDLAEWTGVAPRAFAYPFGVPGADFDATTRELVREAGFGHATANAAAVVGPRTDRLAVGRYAVPDLAGEDFERWLSSLLR